MANTKSIARGKAVREAISRAVLSDIQPGDPLPETARIARALGLDRRMAWKHIKRAAENEGWRIEMVHHGSRGRTAVVRRP